MENRKFAGLAASLTGTLLFLYVLVRAYMLSITHDEALSWLQYRNDPLLSIILIKLPTANNHVLNTLLMRLFGAIFPVSAFIIRLPNVLAYLLYLICGWKVLQLVKQPWIRLVAFLLLSLNPYMLDFFSLARGYGLAMGFQMASMLYLYYYFLNNRSSLKELALCLCFAGLSVLANFAWLNFYLALVTVLLTDTLIRRSLPGLTVRGFLQHHASRLLIIAVISLSLLAYVLPMGIKLKRHEELFYGGNNGFWKDTVSTLSEDFLYGRWQDLNSIGFVQWITGILLFISLLAGTIIYRRKNAQDVFPFYYSILLLLLIAAGFTMLQHLLLDTLYLIHRTALLFVPLFLLLVSILISRILPSLHKAFYILFFALSGMMAYHFTTAANLLFCREWPDLSNRAFAAMKTDVGRLILHNDVSCRVDWMYYPAFSFYQLTDPIPQLYILEKGHADHAYDYFYIPTASIDTFKHWPHAILGQYDLNGSVLIRNMKVREESIIRVYKFFEPGDSGVNVQKLVRQPVYRGETSLCLYPGDFSPSVDFHPAELPLAQPIHLRIRCHMWFEKQPKAGELDIAMKTDKDSIYNWQSRNFDWTLSGTGCWQLVTRELHVPSFRSPQDRLSIFFWNTGKAKFYIDDLEVTVLKGKTVM